jgi:hypothetical protein
MPYKSVYQQLKTVPEAVLCSVVAHGSPALVVARTNCCRGRLGFTSSASEPAERFAKALV